MPMLNARMRINVADIKVDEYRELVSKIMMEHSVKDYITVEAKTGNINVKVRVLIDESSDLLV